MAKIDIRSSSGLPIVLEENRIVSPDITFSNVVDYGIDELREELLNKELTSPNVFYTKYFNLDHDNIYKEKNLSINAYIIPPNLAGIEYTKTKGTILNNCSRVLEVVNGSGTIILQCFEKQYEGDIIINSIKKTQKIVVPPQYYVSISNTRQSPLVILEIVPSNVKETIDLDDMGGMSYYVIRKNAKQEIVRNPAYRLVSKPRKVAWDSLVGKHGITLKTPIVKQLLRKYDKFSWLFNGEGIQV